MLVLGLESATPRVGVALGSDGGVIASFQSSRERRHAETMAPAIDFVCRQAGVELTDVDVVAVDVGPGLFTGLRVGLTTAKAIAHACQAPMVAVTSLEILAFPARITDRLIVSAVDARRSEVYYATYRGEEGSLRTIDEPRAERPEAVAAKLEALDQDCLMVGDGAVRFADVFGRVGRIEIAREGFRFPDAGTLVELARRKIEQEGLVPQDDVEALYLRPPDTT